MNSLRGLWDTIKHTHICIIKVPERETWGKGEERIFEVIITKMFPKLMKMWMYTSKISVKSKEDKLEETILRHIIINYQKPMTDIDSSKREKQLITCKWYSEKYNNWCESETRDARDKGMSYLNCWNMNGKICQSKIWYLTNYPSKIKEKLWYSQVNKS